MSITSIISKILFNHSMQNRKKCDISNIKNKLKQCDVNPLSQGQKQEIQNFYKKHFGFEVPLFWHEYFYSRNNNFSVKYIPTCLYHNEIVYRLNNYGFMNAYVDKNFYDIIFSDVNRPKTIVKNMNGYFYDHEKSISQNAARELCNNLPGAVVKPAQESMWGKGVRIFQTNNGLLDDNNSIESLFSLYSKNFIIQEKVEQHPDMAMLNPTSLNTLRVLSYREGDEIFILYVVVRIGRKGENVDNETAGGINADIDLETGRIKDCAYGTPSEKRILLTDIGTELKGFKVPSFQSVIETVKDLHLRMPYFNIIGWDFGVDKEGKPIMIEWNKCPDLSQTAHGPAFGDMTETIFTRIKSLKNTIRFGY